VGATELNNIGNVGILTGPPFFAAVGAFINGTGDLAIQGVDYKADVAGFRTGGSADGAKMMFVYHPFHL